MIEKDILATNIYTLGYQIPNYRKNKKEVESLSYFIIKLTPFLTFSIFIS